MFRVRNDANMENVIAGKGQHETYWWYDTCRYREANQGTEYINLMVSGIYVGIEVVLTTYSRQNDL